MLIVPWVRRVWAGYLAAVFWIYAYCNEIATYIPKFRSHAICITGILMGIKRCIHFVHIYKKKSWPEHAVKIGNTFPAIGEKGRLSRRRSYVLIVTERPSRGQRVGREGSQQEHPFCSRRRKEPQQVVHFMWALRRFYVRRFVQASLVNGF